MNYNTYINNNIQLLRCGKHSHSLSATVNNWVNVNYGSNYSFNNKEGKEGNYNDYSYQLCQQYDSGLSRNKNSEYRNNVSTEVVLSSPQVVNGLNDSGSNNCVQIQNKIEMINMKMKCAILLSRIENLNIMLPNGCCNDGNSNNNNNVVKLKHNNVNKRKNTLYKKKKHNNSNNTSNSNNNNNTKRKTVNVNQDINDEYNLSNLADELVDVFGLDNSNNNNNTTNNTNITTNDNKPALILDHYGSGRSEEMKLGELIIDTMNDNTTTNNNNNNNNAPTYQDEAVQTSVEYRDGTNSNSNRNILSPPQSNKTSTENDNEQFQPTVIETLPDFNNKEQQQQQQLSQRSLNTEEEEDMILTTIMENAQRMEEERKEEIKKQKENEEKEKIKKKKTVTFNDNDFRLIKYKENDVITKLNIYDRNLNKINFNPRNYNQYLSLLNDITKGVTIYKPCIINHCNSNKSKQQVKHNKMNIITKCKSSNNSNSNGKNKVISVVKKNKNKFKSNLTTHKCVVRQKQPVVKCRRFIENPQKFFTEDLCDNVLNSYNLKQPNTHIYTHTRSKSTSNMINNNTPNVQRSKRKTKFNNISPTKQHKNNISTVITTTSTSTKPKTKVIGNITLDIISDINDTSISHPKHKRKNSI